MRKNSVRSKATDGGAVAVRPKRQPRVSDFEARGIQNGADLVDFLKATCFDVADGSLSAGQAGVVVGATRVIAKMCELQARYGSPNAKTGAKEITVGKP